MTRIIAVTVIIAAAALAIWFFVLRGDDLLEEAQAHAEAACNCRELDCTNEHVAFFNRISAVENDRLTALSEEAQDLFRAAEDRASECQDALRN